MFAAVQPLVKLATLSSPTLAGGKAGRNRWKEHSPTVRGVVMNPVDHPHGGGEAETSGGRHPVNPNGKPEGRTRRPNKGKATSSSFVAVVLARSAKGLKHAS